MINPPGPISKIDLLFDWVLKLETRIAILEQSRCDVLDIAVAKNVADHTPESPSAAENDEPRQDTESTPQEKTIFASVRPTSPSPSEPACGFPAYPGKLSLKIGAALSEGITLTSISEAIDKLINERKNGASNT